MSSLSDNVFDNGLNYILNNAEKVHILSADPGLVWSNIASYGLGNKSSISISSPGDRAGGGREVTVSAFNDGSITADGTATHYAVTKDSASEIIASGELAFPQVVANVNSFSLSAFSIGIPDPAA